MSIEQQVAQSRQAAYRLAVTSTETRNAILLKLRDLLIERQDEVLTANDSDAAAARESGLAKPLYNRLILSQSKIDSIARSLESVVALPDPVGSQELRRELDSGLVLEQVRVPIGVIGVIFESRPDAFVQIGSLALKSANAALLKGGSEALETNRVLHRLFRAATESVDADLADAITLVETREDIKSMLALDGDIDLLIPRGSNALVRFIQENTRIPVLGHADGICHVYVDAGADERMAVAVTKDSKTQYPAVCNAAETLLLHSESGSQLPAIVASMPEVEFRGCERSRAIHSMKPAHETDWSTEYNDLILAVRIVDSLDDAVAHINRFGSHHTDAIVTPDPVRARHFLSQVDSSSVLWNASTRFADGFRYGLGAEVGISTGKVHARGPVGLAGMTTTQYRVQGEGHTVAPYAGGDATFTHRDLT